jgi:murein DD-endopeptidase MepM/ murein hydrolase activator NlpD
MTRGLAPALLMLFMLAACSGGGGPQVRIFDGGTASTTGGATSGGDVSTRTQGGSIHVVRRGDTLYGIARAYGVPLRTLITENAVSPPYTLRIGQEIRIPIARTHVVRRGDTVSGIAEIYRVSMRELVRANGIDPPYTIRIGQRLSIPASPTPRLQRAALPATPPPPPTAPPSEATVSSPPSTPPSTARAEPPPPPPEPSYGPGALPYPDAKPAPPPRMVGPIPTPPARAGGFLWPVQGRIVSGFGPKPAGLHNDGINIAAPRGSPIRASETGVVAYAGDGLQGFGNTILIKHADGYVTAYAHADTLLVARGDVIQRGQAIAQVGSSGTVDRPQVHFQIRRGREAIDPRTVLRTG